MTSVDPEQFAWLQLARTTGLGPVTIKKLIGRYGSAVKALEAVPVLSQRAGRVKKLADAGDIRKEIDLIHKRGARFLCPVDEAYPYLLSQIADAPVILTCKGDTKFLSGKTMLGIVGARNASVNACRLTQKWAAEIGQAGGVIVSGLARGIDTAAHQGSLKTGTVAVLAGGLDNIYPPENQKLADQIAAEGCLLSEEPLTLAPMASHFPKRNRIISGLSHGVLVMEATLKSGSLITARTAAEQGREVMAVPGFPMDPRAQGPNALIKDGAALITGTQDILDALRNFSGLEKQFRLEEKSVSDVLQDEQHDHADMRARILSSLSVTPISLDELAAAIGCNPQILSLPLLELELSGAIRYPSHNKIALGALDEE